ncbi:ABC transporter permease [Dactylosporangium sp. CA-139114]|uniref:ABC transporter permease n=1 Tax=Dactylosporangium sp. CA-139114 TaxID=3239931 RepID=UPI003D952CB2
MKVFRALGRGGSFLGSTVPAVFLAVLVLVALLAPWVAPVDPLAQGPDKLVGPGAHHLLGTDQFGRDILSRLLYGARADLVVSVGATAVAAVLGTTFGLVGGFFRGFIGGLSMRATEVVLAFPPIVLALLVVALFGPGTATLIITMGILFTPTFARVTYGQVLSVRQQDFVTASRMLGAGPGWLLFRVVLPNVLGPILVQTSLTLAATMLLESGLSYLGVGVVPPTPSWGSMIAEAQNLALSNPGFLIISCGIVVVTVLAFSILGDSLDRRFDPRRRNRPAAATAGDLRTVGGAA